VAIITVFIEFPIQQIFYTQFLKALAPSKTISAHDIANMSNDDVYVNPETGLTYLYGGDGANCTVSACPIEMSVYGYRPSLPFSSTIIALYGLCMAAQIYLGIRYKKWSFMVAMILGCIGEIIGYVGRILYYQNPWAGPGFIIQIGKSPSSASLFMI
jgi:hypothetical protein